MSTFYDQNKNKAEDILKDENKTERLLQKTEKKLQSFPVIGNALAYVPLMISLVRSYVKKEYTELPLGSMVSIVVALIYFVSPIDFVPDAIPGVGVIDDIVVISGCLALVQSDLIDYRSWRKENGFEIPDIPEYDEVVKDAQKNEEFAREFFGE